jgi:DNA-binding FrmR family transcriptional regulator
MTRMLRKKVAFMTMVTIKTYKEVLTRIRVLAGQIPPIKKMQEGG